MSVLSQKPGSMSTCSNNIMQCQTQTIKIAIKIMEWAPQGITGILLM